MRNTKISKQQSGYPCKKLKMSKKSKRKRVYMEGSSKVTTYRRSHKIIRHSYNDSSVIKLAVNLSELAPPASFENSNRMRHSRESALAFYLE